MTEMTTPKRKRAYTPIKQPIGAAGIPGAQLKVQTYCEVNGISAATAWRRIRNGEVQVIRHGTRCTRIVVQP